MPHLLWSLLVLCTSRTIRRGRLLQLSWRLARRLYCFAGLCSLFGPQSRWVQVRETGIRRRILIVQRSVYPVVQFLLSLRLLTTRLASVWSNRSSTFCGVSPHLWSRHPFTRLERQQRQFQRLACYQGVLQCCSRDDRYCYFCCGWHKQPQYLERV